MVLAALIPRNWAGTSPVAKLRIKLPRFVFAAILLNMEFYCAISVPEGQVVVPSTHVHGDSRLLSIQLLSLGLAMLIVTSG